MTNLEQMTIEQLKQMDKAELEELAKDIRTFLIEKVTKTGGHLASNLGAVELSIALHYVFDSPTDQILWDVGHQAYVHKILTGRAGQFDTLRQYGGLSGFPRQNESKHDIFSMGHSSDSISVAVGLARARDLQGKHHQVIAVIGDGAMTGGMALEGLNDAGSSENKVIIILNDNEMSIARNVGAIAGFLGKMRTIKSYTRFKHSFSNMLDHLPVFGRPIKEMIKRTKAGIKYLFLPTQLFEEMGFTYIGILDGHDIPSLIGAFNDAEKSEGSVLVHIRTVKGCGCEIAEEHPELFHGVRSDFFEAEDATTPNNGQRFATQLVEMAKKDDRICAVTAAMPHGTGLIAFQEAFPDRFFDVGIAEQHATTMCAGLARGGMRPYFGVYSTFLQRAYDQLVHDVCLQNLPVTFVIDRAGLVGPDGETHHGAFDLSYLRHLPNMVVMSPATASELSAMLEMTLSLAGPMAIRYSKSDFCDKDETPTVYGKWKMLRPIAPVTVVATGNLVFTAQKLASRFKAEHQLEMGVINACFIKPLDGEMLKRLAHCRVLFTLEDNVVSGGMGSAILEHLAVMANRPKVYLYGIPDRFITHGDMASLMQEVGMDEESLYQRMIQALECEHHDQA